MRRVGYQTRRPQTSYIRLSGDALARAGFPVGGNFVCEISPGRIELRAVTDRAQLPANVIAFEQVKAQLDQALQPAA